jgi:hypothetical protein
VAEQAEVGRLLGAEPLPRTARDLNGWIEGHPDIGRAPACPTACCSKRQRPRSDPGYARRWDSGRGAERSPPEGPRSHSFAGTSAPRRHGSSPWIGWVRRHLRAYSGTRWPTSSPA